METTKITEINNIIDTYLNFESLSVIDNEQYLAMFLSSLLLLPL